MHENLHEEALFPDVVLIYNPHLTQFNLKNYSFKRCLPH